MVDLGLQAPSFSWVAEFFSRSKFKQRVMKRAVAYDRLGRRASIVRLNLYILCSIRLAPRNKRAGEKHSGNLRRSKRCFASSPDLPMGQSVLKRSKNAEETVQAELYWPSLLARVPSVLQPLASFLASIGSPGIDPVRARQELCKATIERCSQHSSP